MRPARSNTVTFFGPLSLDSISLICEDVISKSIYVPVALGPRFCAFVGWIHGAYTLFRIVVSIAISYIWRAILRPCSIDILPLRSLRSLPHLLLPLMIVHWHSSYSKLVEVGQVSTLGFFHKKLFCARAIGGCFMVYSYVQISWRFGYRTAKPSNRYALHGGFSDNSSDQAGVFHRSVSFCLSVEHRKMNTGGIEYSFACFVFDKPGIWFSSPMVQEPCTPKLISLHSKTCSMY